MSTNGDNWGDDYSVIGDKGEIGFIDYEDDKSVCSYNPVEEGPLIISVPFPFNGKPQSVFIGDTVVDSITIKNTTDDAMEIWTKIYASTPEDSFKLSLMKPPTTADSAGNSDSRRFVASTKLEDRMVQPGETLTIWLSCMPKDIGLHTSVVQFDVGSDQIERVVFLLAEDKISQSLSSNKPYARGKSARQFSVESFVRGSRPPRTTDRKFKRRLPRYDIPKASRERIEKKEIPDFIFEGLTCTNYSSYFKTLLIMEEIQLEEDMRAYDMENVNMRRNGCFLSLQVPGLAERRPSLVHGDYIFAKISSTGADMDSAFQGYIHRVESDKVYLKFAPEFHAYHRDGNFYDVRFTYNRINLRRLYQAIDAAENLDLELLFPSESPGYRLIRTTPLVPKTCTLNEEQMRAIEMVLGCKGGPPYVIYGPPGTGKTMTLVEAVLQLYTTQEHACILLCAPSNSAADHILEKLLSENDHQLEEREVFRLNATSRSYDDVKPDHIHFCFFDEQVFKCPPFSALGRYRIIISTYMSSSLLFAEGVEEGYFSHIFLDEAGQASEPESMIPIANFWSPDTVVVLAGDPMQLGPVVYSRDAESHGLGKSYLERLCDFGYYAEGDENYVTKLVRNYRCHPEILHLPSTLFYNGELISCKDESGSFLKSLKFLPNKDFPVFFFGIQGCDEREGNNPSWFNRIEISKVAEFIRSLIQTGSLSEEDIGVITPYRQQVLKLKKTLENIELPDIKVGSVEQFQGQERQVIIISTVRSTIRHNNFDRIHCLGFLSNPKRFNVAITRAISLLVIVGNPHIIAKDRYWSKLIWHSSDNNSYMGCALPERQEYDEVPVNEDNLSQSNRVDEWVQDSVGTEAPQPVDEAEFSDGWN